MCVVTETHTHKPEKKKSRVKLKYKIDVLAQLQTKNYVAHTRPPNAAGETIILSLEGRTSGA